MSTYAVKWNCFHGHTGVEFFETEILADVRAAYIRMGVCDVCGASGLGTSFAPYLAPAAAETQPLPVEPAPEPGLVPEPKLSDRPKK